MKINELRDKEKKSNKKTGASSLYVAKAGLWYTVCNFFFRGMAFLTTPFFTRILSKAELGVFSNYSSWLSILSVLTSFDLAQSVIRSKLEHEQDIDSYMWSILAFSSIWTVFVYLIFCIFPAQFVEWMQIEPRYINVMFVYLFTTPAYSILVTKHRAFYRYKLFVVLTGVAAVSSTLLSLALVVCMDNKLMGRILGYSIPFIIMGGSSYIIVAIRGKKIKFEYWRYACVVCLPLVPHTLSLYLLGSSDKIIITQISGAEYTAVYSVAYSAYHITTILFDSMNKAWAPWLLESLHLKKYENIKKTSKIYILVFFCIIICILLLVPEIVLLLGGRRYIDAVYCLPPLITSCMIQLIYTMYVNIEFYEKKTFGVSAATIVATFINIALNYGLIPSYPEKSFVIASYTTLVGYTVLFIMHYFLVKHMKLDFVYDIKFILLVLLLTIIVSGLMNLLYRLIVIRYCIILVYSIMILIFGFKHKSAISNFIGKNKCN